MVPKIYAIRSVRTQQLVNYSEQRGTASRTEI